MKCGSIRMTGTVLVCTLLMLAGGSAAFAQTSPWLPAPGAASLSLSHIDQYAERYFRGSSKTAGPPGGANLGLVTQWLTGNFGLTDSLALDFRVGQAESEHNTDGGPPKPAWSLDGLADTSVGLTWRVRDEVVSGGASVAIRGGLILAGDYEAAYINSIGDGADGAEISATVGKFVGERFALSAEVGWRYRSEDVPNETLVNLSAGVILGGGFGLNATYQIVDSASGLDVGGPGFSPDRFPALQEDITLLGATLSWSVADQLNPCASMGEVIDCRTTAASEIWGLGIGYSFNTF